MTTPATWLDAETVDLLKRAASDLDSWAEENVFGKQQQTIDNHTAALLRWVADPASAGPVLTDSAVAIAKAVLGED